MSAALFHELPRKTSQEFFQDLEAQGFRTGKIHKIFFSHYTVIPSIHDINSHHKIIIKNIFIQ